MKKIIPALLIILVLVSLTLSLIVFYPYKYAFSGYPKVTNTSSGDFGDPINIAFVGSKEDIKNSFEKAGWLVPDPITRESSARIAADSLLHKSYPNAPVSNLYLFGRMQDMAFEKPTMDVQKRSHIRIWNTGEIIDGENLWIAQTSYDDGIELSSTNHFPTHHISPTVDSARDLVGNNIQNTKQMHLQYSQPVLYARNGGGDFYESDGDILIISYSTKSFSINIDKNFLYVIKNDIFKLYTQILNGLMNIGINV